MKERDRLEDLVIEGRIVLHTLGVTRRTSSIYSDLGVEGEPGNFFTGLRLRHLGLVALSVLENSEHKDNFIFKKTFNYSCLINVIL
jgi:hypothetical protein